MNVLLRKLKTLSVNRRWLLPAGVLLVALGLTAYLSPAVAVSGLLLLMGLSVTVAGVNMLVHRIRHKAAWPALAGGLMWVIAGLLLIVYPFVSLALLNSIVSIALISRAIRTLLLRRKGGAGRNGGLVSPLWGSILLLILAVAIQLNPLLLPMVLTFVAGFPLVLLGLLMIGVAFLLRRLPGNIRNMRSPFEEQVKDAEYEIVEEHIHGSAGV